MPVNPTTRTEVADSIRTQLSGAFTSVASTSILTVPAAVLNVLQIGDVVRLSGLTGGSGFSTVLPYYISEKLSTTTIRIAASIGGAPVSGTTDVSAGTISAGSVVSAAGLLAGNYVSPYSVAGGLPGSNIGG